MLISITVPVSASPLAPTSEIEVWNVDMPSDFNINDNQQYLELLQKYNIPVKEVIDVKEIQGDRKAPAGVLVLQGTYLSSRQWKMTLLNVGVYDVTAFQTDVKCYNNTYGPVVNSKE